MISEDHNEDHDEDVLAGVARKDTRRPGLRVQDSQAGSCLTLIKEVVSFYTIHLCS